MSRANCAGSAPGDAVLDDLRDPARRRRHHRSLAGHGLQVDDPERLVDGRAAEHCGVAHDLDHLLPPQRLRDPDDAGPPVLQAGHLLGDLGGQAGRVRCARTEHQLGAGVYLIGGVEQVRDALLAGDPADEDHGRGGGVDPVALQGVDVVIGPVLLGVHAVVDDDDPLRVHGRVALQHVEAHLPRYRDDGFGSLDRGSLAEARQGVAPGSELLGLPEPLRLEAVAGHDVGKAVEELGGVPAQVRVPCVAVHHRGIVEARCHREIDGKDLEGPRVVGGAWPGGGVPEGLDHRLPRPRFRPLGAETADLDGHRAGQLRGQVGDVDPRAAVHLGGILAAHQDDLHEYPTSDDASALGMNP
jgi:hypothetical protein